MQENYYLDSYERDSKGRTTQNGIFLDAYNASNKDITCFNPHYQWRKFNNIKSVPKVHSSYEYLYAIEIDNKYVKIGFSKSLNKRLKEHLKNTKGRIELGRCGIIGPVRDGLMTEQIIHHKLNELRIDGYTMDNRMQSEEIYDFNLIMNDQQNTYNSYEALDNIIYLIQACTQISSNHKEHLIIPRLSIITDFDI